VKVPPSLSCPDISAQQVFCRAATFQPVPEIIFAGRTSDRAGWPGTMRELPYRYLYPQVPAVKATRAAISSPARDLNCVQKEELLHLHMLMFHIRMYFESVACCEIRTERYDSLAISPFHIHKGKRAHSDAVLTLAAEIVSSIHDSRPVVAYTSPGTALVPTVVGEH